MDVSAKEAHCSDDSAIVLQASDAVLLLEGSRFDYCLSRRARSEGHGYLVPLCRVDSLKQAKDSLGAWEVCADARKLLRFLPTRKQRLVLTLHLDGFTAWEISRELGCSTQRVRHIIGRAPEEIARRAQIQPRRVRQRWVDYLRGRTPFQVKK
jgi:hypothetical protein